MKSRVEDAVNLFMSGYNCCQSVFSAYSDLFGLDRETALKLSCSMGGGIGRMREVCGTVSGMAMIAGLVCGNTDPTNQDAKTKNYETVRKMADAFKKEHQTIICREILGLLEAEESASPEARTAEYYKKRPCARIVATAARIIEETFPELLEENCGMREDGEAAESEGKQGNGKKPESEGKQAGKEKPEILPVVNEAGEVIGRADRKEVHQKGLWHPVVHCWMYAKQDDQIWFYFQKRSEIKDDFPGYYDIGSTGHVADQETAQEAVVREAEEEMGIRMEEDRLHYLGTVKEEMDVNGCNDREIAQVYLYHLDIPFFAPGEEVSEVIAVSKEELEKKELKNAPYIQGHSLCGEPVFLRAREWCCHEGEYQKLVMPFFAERGIG